MQKLLLLAIFFSLPVLAAQPRQIFLSRHMEKVVGAEDPALSPCGAAQAQAFADQLRETKLPLLLHTPYQRTQQTAQAFLKPGRQLQSYDPRQVAPLLNQLNTMAENALVIGHSNTIPELVSQLTGQPVAALSEQEYGRIYILTQQDKEWQLEIQQLPSPKECQSTANSSSAP